MAMEKCRECGASVSDAAKICPNCGIPNPVKKTSALTIIIITLSILILLIILLSAIVYNSNTNNKTNLISDSTQPSSEPIASVNQWAYFPIDDPMRKGTIYHAALISLNTVNFNFPYQGEQHASLTLRSSTRDNDVIFSIGKGQILCHSSCTVSVRFDDADAVNFDAVGAADNSTETIFISNYKHFLAKIIKAKKIKIAANIYQQGTPVFEFDVSGFSITKFKPAK